MNKYIVKPSNGWVVYRFNPRLRSVIHLRDFSVMKMTEQQVPKKAEYQLKVFGKRPNFSVSITQPPKCISRAIEVRFNVY